ncbi:hypothetical protein M0813_21013 [Anaeramoeba flamelloides]|uniref:Uncharacterized protein n=1 Tax=Anaeramoeba flamelloides TaxID=1746091 RepID=A0ABQ8YJZ9_9EUKA|nr:hypothetical protein M0813_21013 [Anaeramoeba flamelloides]
MIKRINPFLEIKKNNKTFKGTKTIAPVINTNHFIKSNEHDLIQINNTITHEDQIAEDFDQGFGIGSDFNEESSYDNTHKNNNNFSYKGSVDIFQTHLLNNIYPPNWGKVNTTCGEVWLDLFQICRKRNIPNTVLDCILGWVNKYFILKNEKSKKLPNYSKYFYSNLMNLLPTGKSSLGGLYMFVENVKSCWRMKDPLIFLIANFPYELKIYDVLKKTKLVEDLKLLERGIHMGTKFVKAKVYSVVGDLPAQLEARGRIMHQGLYSCATCNLSKK